MSSFNGKMYNRYYFTSKFLGKDLVDCDRNKSLIIDEMTKKLA
jgi:hypothetical protein